MPDKKWFSVALSLLRRLATILGGGRKLPAQLSYLREVDYRLPGSSGFSAQDRAGQLHLHFALNAGAPLPKSGDISMSIGSLSRPQKSGDRLRDQVSSDFSMMKKVLSFPLTPGFSISISSIRFSRLFGRCWFIVWMVLTSICLVISSFSGKCH